jgi:hypothetical protein
MDWPDHMHSRILVVSLFCDFERKHQHVEQTGPALKLKHLGQAFAFEVREV